MAAPLTAATSFPLPLQPFSLPYKPSLNNQPNFLLEAETLIQTPTRAHLSLPRLLKSCAKSSALSLGQQLHALSFKLHLSSDLFVQTSLISFYSSVSHLHHALQIFDQMPHRNAVAWTASINACVRSDDPTAALSLFHRMQESGIRPDAFTIVSILSACTHLGALNLGRGAHAHIKKMSTELTAFVGTALVDMYCKCGRVDDAITVFNSMPIKARNIQTWNAMLHGLSLHGLGSEAVKLFKEMEINGVRPNEVTFVSLLCGCAHSGLVEEGRFYFDAMRKKYNIEHNVKHYGCMVDLLGRAGLLDEAFEVVSCMRVPTNHVVWGALLGACMMHDNVAMAEQVMERIVIEDPPPTGDTSHYVVMSNIYRKVGQSEKLAEVRAMVGKKPKGRSWIEIGGQVHEFWAGGDVCLHPMWDEIKKKLDEMEGRLGSESALEDWENPHSEKVALALGLVRTTGPSTIRISKNLRICCNCHDLMKWVSEAYEREIIVRDCNRFHRFIGGVCSCKDYW